MATEHEAERAEMYSVANVAEESNEAAIQKLAGRIKHRDLLTPAWFELGVSLGASLVYSAWKTVLTPADARIALDTWARPCGMPRRSIQLRGQSWISPK
jgi:hypothetical protein